MWPLQRALYSCQTISNQRQMTDMQKERNTIRRWKPGPIIFSATELSAFTYHERAQKSDTDTHIYTCLSQARKHGSGSGEPTVSAGMHRRVASQPNVNSQHTCVHASLLWSCFPFPPGAHFSSFRPLLRQLPQMQSHHRISYTNTALGSPRPQISPFPSPAVPSIMS